MAKLLVGNLSIFFFTFFNILSLSFDFHSNNQNGKSSDIFSIISRINEKQEKIKWVIPLFFWDKMGN